MKTTVHNAGRRDGFTMAEMIVVVAIIVLLTIIALPSFKAMIDSSEEAMAEGMLRTAVRSGRDAAIQAGDGTDAALVFFFTPGGRLTATPYVRAGSFQEFDGLTPTDWREVFIPAPGVQTVQLPKGWMVRAYAPLNSIEPVQSTGFGWYNSVALGQSGNVRYEPQQSNWVFPETGFFDSAKDGNLDGIHRQTFMLRFRGGTGELLTAPVDPVLVFVPNLDPRGSAPGALNPTSNLTLATLRRTDAEKYIRKVLSGQLSTTGTGGNARSAVANLIGRRSSDMVMARAVGQIALYEDRKLAGALGVDVDSDTGSLYALPRISPAHDNSPENLSRLPGPRLTGELPNNPSGVLGKITPWFEGGNIATDHLVYLDPTYPPSAKIYGIDRYAGALRPIVMQGLASQ